MTFKILISPLFRTFLKYFVLGKINNILNFSTKLMYVSLIFLPSTHLYEIINLHSSIINNYL